LIGVSYLIDTDWVIDHFNNRAPATQRLRELQSHGLAISITTVGELWEGVLLSNSRERAESLLRRFIGQVHVVEIDEEVSERFGQIRGTLRREGNLIGDLDILIAASAQRYDLMLLTNNRKHFERIEGLRIESLP
jgi:tRNA(fMet)-specific endonuclease VapC